MLLYAKPDKKSTKTKNYFNKIRLSGLLLLSPKLLVFFVLFKKQKRPPKRTAVIFKPPNPKDTGGQTGNLFYGSLIA